MAARTGVPIRGRERVRNGCDQSRLRTRKAPQTSGERLSNAGSVTQGPRTHTKARQKPPNAGSERLRAKGNARFLTQRKERRTLGRTRERGPLGPLLRQKWHSIKHFSSEVRRTTVARYEPGPKGGSRPFVTLFRGAPCEFTGSSPK